MVLSEQSGSALDPIHITGNGLSMKGSPHHKTTHRRIAIATVQLGEMPPTPAQMKYQGYGRS